MKKLNITKERFEKSRYFKRKYGKLAFVSESGKIYKTEKGHILKFVKEAREYVNDDSIEADTAEEFIIFDDPDIFNKIANVQKKEEQKVEKEIEQKDVSKQDIEQEVQKTNNGPGIGSAVASSAISGATNIITNPTVISLAAGAYAAKKTADNIEKIADDFKNLKRVQKSNAGTQQLLQKRKEQYAANGVDLDVMFKGMDYANNLSDEQEKALGLDKFPDDNRLHNMEYHKIVAQGLPENERKNYLNSAMNFCNKYGSNAVAAGSAVAGGVSTGAVSGTTIFGMSLATIGWIAAGVAAAAIITPYIYDKIRACTKTWLADIIAEIKFKSDGKDYRCFYDLDENKWILTYANVKWTSYMDNKLDKETTEEFFNSQFFKKFLDKCKQTFALLFSTGRNEVVFKTLPEIKDAPKELKDILEKIYDNKGAITKNLFSGKHD